MSAEQEARDILDRRERRRARVARIEQALAPVDAAWQVVSAPIRWSVERVWAGVMVAWLKLARRS